MHTGNILPLFVQTEQEREDNRQSATAEDVRTEETVFRAENKQCDQNPKGDVVTLGATIHKKPPVFRRRVCKEDVFFG